MESGEEVALEESWGETHLSFLQMLPTAFAVSWDETFEVSSVEVSSDETHLRFLPRNSRFQSLFVFRHQTADDLIDQGNMMHDCPVHDTAVAPGAAPGAIVLRTAVLEHRRDESFSTLRCHCDSALCKLPRAFRAEDVGT